MGVPGEVNGLYTAWQMFGRAKWKDLFAASIHLCEEGFPVFASLAKAIKTHGDLIRVDAGLRLRIVMLSLGGIYYAISTIRFIICIRFVKWSENCPRLFTNVYDALHMC